MSPLRSATALQNRADGVAGPSGFEFLPRRQNLCLMTGMESRKAISLQVLNAIFAMKVSISPFCSGFRSKLAPITLVAGLFGMGAQPAFANFLIQVDVSNPAAVVFSSLNSTPLVSDSGTFTFDGITLLDFFTAPQSGADPVSGDLSARGLGSYTRFSLDEASGSRVDLNFFVQNGIETQVFDTNERAFEGASTLFLSPVASFLPGEGVLGDIIVGWSRGMGSSGTVIGQWRVVPEVSTVAPGVMGLALAGWLVWRRFGTQRPQA